MFKLHLLTDTEVTFVLTNGGHTAGIVSEPGHPHRHFRIALRKPGEPYVDPDAWFAETIRAKALGGRHGPHGLQRDSASPSNRLHSVLRQPGLLRSKMRRGSTFS